MPHNAVGAKSWRLSKRVLSRWSGVPLWGKLTTFLETADRMLLDGMPHEEAAQILEAFHPLSRFENGGEAGEFWDKIFATSRKLTARRRVFSKTRSLWGTTPIVGLKYGVESDRRLGFDAKSLVFNSYYISSSFDINLKELDQFIIENHIDLFYTFRRYVFAWSLLNFDVFHFYNDCGIMQPQGGYGSDRFGINLTEMQALRRAGKTLFTYAYGADHRMRQRSLELDPISFCMECPEPGKFCVCDDAAATKMLETIRENSTRMLGFGLSMELLPDARFLNFLVLDPDEVRPDPALAPAGAARAGNAPLRVGHFPNHGFFKGTRFLTAAIDELRSEGVRIELVQFSGLGRHKILAAMQDVDVVVDQLISGAIGLTAVEAMALSRPVIARLRPGVQISARDECPVIVADPATIKNVLAGIVADPTRLAGLGARGRRYVLRHYSIDALAVALNGLYRDHLPFAPLSAMRRSYNAYRASQRIENSATTSGMSEAGRHGAPQGYSPVD
jgi:hypothetical protein